MFLELTKMDGDNFLVNTDQISSITSHGQRLCQINMSNDDFYHVKESYKEIKDAITKMQEKD